MEAEAAEPLASGPLAGLAHGASGASPPADPAAGPPACPDSDGSAGLRHRTAAAAVAAGATEAAGAARAAAASGPDDGPSLLSWPRWLVPVLSLGLILSCSFSYAQRRMAQRVTALRPENRVPRLLDALGMHHVGVPVTNISRSLSFYGGVLGGRELEAGASRKLPLGPGSVDALDGESAVAWRFVAFGQMRVLLWESRSLAQAINVPALRPHLALRLAAGVDVGRMVAAVAERVKALPDLGVGPCQENASMQPEWAVVICTGPDGEDIHFWRPSARITKLFEQARQDWAATASDARGRDLFE